jgi:hypothetical protein
MMSDSFESVLRATFHERAEQLDPLVVTRLHAVDYLPSRRHRRVISGLAGIGLSAAAAVVAMAMLASNATPAFAGWTPTPIRPTPGHVTTASQKCGLGIPVLTETRGPYTAAVYATPSGIGTCLQGQSVSFSGTVNGPAEAVVAAGQIQTFVSSSTDSSGDGFTVLDGRVGAGVTAVAVERASRIPITATVSGGWYLAWWPESAHATAVQITSTSGMHTAELPAAATQGPSSCGGMEGCGSISYPIPSGRATTKAQHSSK